MPAKCFCFKCFCLFYGPLIGYENVGRAINLVKNDGLSLKEALLSCGASEEMINIALNPANLRKFGM
jgi:hypothetical protein